MTDITVALIGAGGSVLVGLFTLIGVIITNNKNSKKVEHKLEISQAVSNTKLEDLTREVREHNNFARRMPVVEQEIRDIKEDIKHLKQYHSERV